MTNKLTFVNGEKAACGCHYEFSSGGGEYSDVADVHLCALHAGGTSAPDDRKAQPVADAREAFACRYNADPADPACATDLAVYSAGWRDAQPTLATVLDDRWKARILDGRTLKRDEMGLGDHPELPWLDEGMKPRGFYAALGLELTHTMAEDQLDGDALEAMSEAVNWTDWTPAPPQGDGWKLVAIFDTEEGPAAWWLRELAEAEDGTTTIRNLQAEVEKMKKAYTELAGMFHDQIVSQQAAYIEWQHGGGAEVAMGWIENGLCGPGHIPDEDAPYSKEPQAWFDANKYEPFPACPCGRPSNILWMGQGFCCNAHYDKAFKTHQATKAAESAN